MKRTVAALMTVLASTTAAAQQDSTAVGQGNPILNIEVGDILGNSKGVIQIELFDNLAPSHVDRVITLASDGDYDDVLFYRVIEGFMAQTGDVQYGKLTSDQQHFAGMGGSDHPDLAAEFSDTPFLRGTVGMARARDPDTANSQFFIMFEDGNFLNNNYTLFGKVVSGMNIVDGIKRGDANRNGVVFQPDYMMRVWTDAADAQ